MTQINAGRVRFVSRGEYNNSTQYYLFDLVNYNGNSYYAKENTLGNLPTDASKWQLIAEKGSTGSTGPTGATGNGIASIVKTSTSGTVDTYTITYTDGTTTTFNVTNGEVSQAQLDELQAQVDRYKMLENALPHIAGTGTELTLNNTANAPMSMVLNPNTSQETTTGKNKLNVNKNPDWVYETTEYETNNNIVKVKNYGTNSYAYVEYYIDNLKPNTTYTISFDATINNSIVSIDIMKVRGTSTSSGRLLKIDGTTSSSYSGQFTTPDDTSNMSINLYSLRGTYQANATTTYTNLQIEEGSTATTYEPYTGAIPSPNPDYPQDIHVVSGDNTLKVGNKNLFDDIIIGQAWNGTSNTARALIYAKVNPNENYTISFGSITGIDSLNYFEKVNKDDNVLNYGTQVISQTTTKETKSGTNYIGIQINKSNITLQDVLNIKLQLEKGSTATTYEPHEEQVVQLNLGINLPSGYTQVEYIGSSGIQYIDTAIKPNSNTKIDIIFEKVSNYGQYPKLFGSEVSNHANMFKLDLRNPFVAGYSTEEYTTSLSIQLNTKYDISFRRNLLIVNNQEYTYQNTDNIQNNYNIYLFASNRANSVLEGSAIKLYSCKIYDNGTLVRNFIPCYKISNDVIGLYDIVNNVFYTNQGEGAFTKGNDVPNGLEYCKIGDYKDKFVLNINSNNLFDKATITTGKMINKNTGNPDNDSGTNCSDYIDISKYANVILSGATISYSNGGAFYDKNKTYVSGFSSSALKNGLAVPNNVVYIRFNMLPVDVDTTMLNKGLIALPYEPYTDNKWYLKKNIGKVVLDGSESWRKASATDYDRFILDLTTAQQIYIASTNSLSNYFIYSVSNVIGGWRSNAGEQYIINFSVGGTTTLEEFKTWLSTHNTELIQPRKQPTYTLLNDTLQNALNTLESKLLAYKGQTNITQVNDDLPFEIVASALKDISNL